MLSTLLGIKSFSTLHFFLATNPFPPLPKLLIIHTLLLPLIPHDFQIAHLPPLLPAPQPSRLPHQAQQRLLLRPALLDGHIRQICRPIPFMMVVKTDFQSMHAKFPVHWIRACLEICEQCDGYFELGQLG